MKYFPLWSLPLEMPRPIIEWIIILQYVDWEEDTMVYNEVLVFASSQRTLGSTVLTLQQPQLLILRSCAQIYTCKKPNPVLHHQATTRGQKYTQHPSLMVHLHAVNSNLVLNIQTVPRVWQFLKQFSTTGSLMWAEPIGKHTYGRCLNSHQSRPRSLVPHHSATS